MKFSQLLARQILRRPCFDLGNRASDLVQPNLIVWVEGPSDRLYVAHWLAKYDAQLVEGAHYSIMFCGGSLLNHLSAQDGETDELIRLLRINRNIAIVIGSDKDSETDDLNETKQRVISELAEIDAQSWVTEGYTIENYIPVENVKKAIETEYPSQAYVFPGGIYKSPLGRKVTGKTYHPSKVMIARRVVDANLDWSIWPGHLQAQVEVLSRRIREANDLGAMPTE